MTTNDLRKNALAMAGALLIVAVPMLMAGPGALAHHCKGAHAGEPGCDGGGDGGVTIPLMTTFECPSSGTERANCPEPGDHQLIQGDTASRPYEDDFENVLNRVGKTGRIAFSTGNKKTRPKPRSVYWDVTHVNSGIWLPNGGVLFTTTEDMDALGITHRTVIHVGTQFVARGSDLRTMVPGETVDVDMEADILFDTGKGGSDGALVRFDPYGDRCNGRITSAVQVTRTDDGAGKRQWTVSVPPGALACVITFPGDLGDYVFGPFGFVVDEL